MSTIYRYPGAANPETYEWENLIADQEQKIEAFMQSVVDFDDGVVVDLGAGSAFHATRFAESAHRVYAVEPDPDMLAQAFSRLAANPRPNVSVIAAGADDVPLRDGIADVVHARFAYFFGPEDEWVRSCEPGVHEALRLLRPGGAFFVIDNHLTSGDFADLLLKYAFASAPSGDAEQERRDAFWREQRFQRKMIDSSWSAPTRDVLRQVMAMEFPAEHIDAIMADIDGTSLTYHYDVYWRRR